MLPASAASLARLLTGRLKRKGYGNQQRQVGARQSRARQPSNHPLEPGRVRTQSRWTSLWIRPSCSSCARSEAQTRGGASIIFGAPACALRCGWRQDLRQAAANGTIAKMSCASDEGSPSSQESRRFRNSLQVDRCHFSSVLAAGLGAPAALRSSRALSRMAS